MSGQLPQVPNYLPNIQSPFQAAVQGLQLGQAFGEAAGETQRRENMQSAMQAFQRNPSAQTLTPLLTALPPQSAEVLRKHWEGMEVGQRDSQIAFGGQAMSAILAGRPDLAKSLFDQRADALENAGRANDAKFFRDMGLLVEVNPQAVLGGTATLLGTADAGERMLRNILAARGAPTTERTALAGARRGEAQATTEEAQAGVAAEAAAAEAARKRAEVEKIYAEISDKQGEIPESARTIVNQSADALFSARSRAQNAASLAEKFEQVYSQGLLTRAGDAIGNVFGSQGASQRLRQEYERLANSETIKALPPGTATEKEFAVIRAGFPAANAPPSAVRDFLKSLERLSRYEEAYQDARGQWAAANGQLGPSRRDFTIDGIQVPRGTTFANFARQYLGVAQDRIAAQEAENLARSRGYGRVLQEPSQ
jgi:hypothetical protein